jgi:hypothetical protein
MKRPLALRLLSNVAVFCALPPLLAAFGAAIVADWLELPGWVSVVLCAVFMAVLSVAGTYFFWEEQGEGAHPLALRWLYFVTAFFAPPAVLAALAAGLVSAWLELPGWAGVLLWAALAGALAVGLYFLVTGLGWRPAQALRAENGRRTTELPGSRPA